MVKHGSHFIGYPLVAECADHWGMADLTDADVFEAKRFLDEICADLKRWLPEPRWEAGWRSEAAGEFGNHEVGPDGPWGELPVRAVYLAAALFLEAVLQCLRAMSAALTAETTCWELPPRL